MRLGQRPRLNTPHAESLSYSEYITQDKNNKTLVGVLILFDMGNSNSRLEPRGREMRGQEEL